MRVDTELLIQEYQTSLFSAAFTICKNREDAEDAVQETFLQYHIGAKQFESEPHIRAWLLRVVINRSKNTVLSFWRRKKTSLDEIPEWMACVDSESQDLMETVLTLPSKYRIVIHLYYYEDYSVREIANILQITEANVKKRLSRGRSLLKAKLKGEWEDDE